MKGIQHKISGGGGSDYLSVTLSAGMSASGFEGRISTRCKGEQCLWG